MARIHVAVFAFVLAGCGQGDRLSPQHQGIKASPQVSRTENVGGLVVGHRLMAAGEYELALKEYLRAGSEQGLNADVLSALGSVNLRLGRLGQAEDLLRKAIDKDETYAAAWNNLGVVLMEKGQIGEASRVFRTAFALDSGQSVEIKENLSAAIAQLHNPAYTSEKRPEFDLVRNGGGQWRLISDP